MSNKFPSGLEAEQIVALYMVHAQTDTVSTADLNKFNDFLSKRFAEYDLNLPQNKRFNCVFLYSDFYLRSLQTKTPAFFKVSKKNQNNERQITCVEGNYETLEKEVLSQGMFQNPEFAKTIHKLAQDYVEAEHVIKKPKTKEKKLTQEQDDQRWWDNFGK